jgi:hypothetical protein
LRGFLRPRWKGVLNHLDLLDALSISDDLGLTETVHLVLEELSALDVVGEVVCVVGGNNGNPLSLILQGIAVILQATPGEGMFLLLLLELLQDTPLALDAILVLQQLGGQVVIAELLLQHLVLQLGNLCLECLLTRLVQDLHLVGVLALLHKIMNHQLTLLLLLG